MKVFLSAIYGLLASMNPAISGALIAIPTVLGFFTFVHSQVAEMMTRIDSLTAVSSPGTISFSALGLIEHFFPFSETVTMFLAWIALLLVCSGIRIVKAFIPTVAS